MRGPLILAILLGSSGIARAEEEQRMVLPAKRGLVQAFVEINLSVDEVGKPVAIAPDVWYGVNDKLTIGVVHSSRGATGFTGAVGDGICVTGVDNGCEAAYSTAGVGARFHLKGGSTAIAADVGLHAGDIDPFQMAVKLGAGVRWHSGKLAIELTPSLFVGVTNRDADADDGGAQPNHEVVFLPATVLLSVATSVAVAVQTGAVLPFDATGDSWSLPFTVGAHVSAGDAAFLELAFTLPEIAGGGEPAGVDRKTLTIGGGYAF